MIPSDIDCLIPVERRLLLVLNRFGSSKPIKSFKIDGAVIGELHPHGSAYSTLVNLVRNGFASDDDSSWGGQGLNDTNASASRYTETRIRPWVSKFAFEFIKHVPWELLELDYEPLYLPSIIPLGLIGDGVITGIAYHRALIPKYTKEDLAKRLKWLVENGLPQKPKNFNGKMDESKYGPLIIPNKPNCTVTENEKNAFYKLLMLGEGDVLYSPKVETRVSEVDRGKKKQKVQFVSVEGRAPNATFEPLINAYGKNALPLASAPIDQSNKEVGIRVFLELKRGTDPEEFKKTLSSKYLDKVLHFKCYTCDLHGVVHQTGIDELLINCFSRWKEAYNTKLRGDVESLNTRFLEYEICSFIRDKINKDNINNLDDILKLWGKGKRIEFVHVDNENKIQTHPYEITEDDIKKIYSETPIRKLVEYKTNYDDLTEKVKKLQDELNNIDKRSIERIEEIVSNVGS